MRPIGFWSTRTNRLIRSIPETIRPLVVERVAGVVVHGGVLVPEVARDEIDERLADERRLAGARDAGDG
ncbi:MAG TPA: hypothetical protein VIV58_24965, partial [Kofleriaceae bacterium]